MTSKQLQKTYPNSYLGYVHEYLSNQDKYEWEFIDGYVIIIRFLNIEIVNNFGHKHIIPEIFVLINFCGSNSFFDLYPIRRKYSYSEVSSDGYIRYIHSHARGDSFKNTEKDWETPPFCLGASDTPLEILRRTKPTSVFSGMMLVNCIDSYLKWESLNGGPYVLMNEITNLQPIFNNTYTYNKKLTEDIKFNILPNGKVSISGIESLISEEDYTYQIGNRYFNSQYVSEKNFEKKKKYFLENYYDNYNYDFIFKGKLVEFELLRDEQIKENYNKIIHPHKLKSWEDQLTRAFRKWYAENFDKATI